MEDVIGILLYYRGNVMIMNNESLDASVHDNKIPMKFLSRTLMAHSADSDGWKVFDDFSSVLPKKLSYKKR